eukprot:760467-Hanusia_phi.AAC.16
MAMYRSLLQSLAQVLPGTLPCPPRTISISFLSSSLLHGRPFPFMPHLVHVSPDTSPQLALERVQSDQHEDESHDQVETAIPLLFADTPQSAYMPASSDKESGRMEMEEEMEGEEQQMQEQVKKT